MYAAKFGINECNARRLGCEKNGSGTPPTLIKGGFYPAKIFSCCRYDIAPNFIWSLFTA